MLWSLWPPETWLPSWDVQTCRVYSGLSVDLGSGVIHLLESTQLFILVGISGIFVVYPGC